MIDERHVSSRPSVSRSCKIVAVSVTSCVAKWDLS
jgi:hypothetical protein